VDEAGRLPSSGPAGSYYRTGPGALSYAERSRVIPHRRPVPLPPGHGATGGTLLVDGLWQADWKIIRGTLRIEPFIPLSPACRDAIEAEGERLLGFAAPATAVRDVRFAPVRSAKYQTQGRSGAGRDLR